MTIKGIMICICCAGTTRVYTYGLRNSTLDMRVADIGFSEWRCWVFAKVLGALGGRSPGLFFRPRSLAQQLDTSWVRVQDFLLSALLTNAVQSIPKLVYAYDHVPI